MNQQKLGGGNSKIFGIIAPILEMIHFDDVLFFKGVGEKPPPRNVLVLQTKGLAKNRWKTPNHGEFQATYPPKLCTIGFSHGFLLPPFNEASKGLS